MIIAAADLLNRKPQPTEAEVRRALAAICVAAAATTASSAPYAGDAGEREHLTRFGFEV